MGVKDLLSEMEAGDEELASMMIFKRFGDEQSTLLDRYERLAFEVHLNKAMQLGRSLSECAVPRSPPPLPPQPKPVRRGLRPSSVRTVMKKLLSPILGSKVPSGKDEGPLTPKSWKKLRRSLRF